MKHSTSSHHSVLIIALALVGTLYSFIGVTSWKFAVVGDEWAFFNLAESIAEQHLWVNPFGLQGVYGTHRVLESYSQAIFLLLFGKTFAVWKFSSVVMLFPSLLVLYKFVNELYGRDVALLAMSFMTFSKYLSNFFKIGYTHSFCFFLFLVCLYYAARLLNAPSRKNALKLGLSLGLAFFAYIGPLFVFFLLPVFITLIYRRHTRSALIYCKKNTVVSIFLITGTVFLAVVAVGFLTTPAEQWFGGLQKTSVHREFESNRQILINIGRNFCLFWKNFDYFYNHFVEGPYLDGITRWLAAFGIAFCLFACPKQGILLLWLWGMLCFGIGLTNPYWYTPTARGIFFVPYGVIFAAIGTTFLLERFSHFGIRKIVLPLMMLVIVLNIYEAQIGVFRKIGYNRTALILKELLALKRHQKPFVLLHSSEYNYNMRHLHQLMRFYNISPEYFSQTQDMQRACPGNNAPIIGMFHDDRAISEEQLVTYCQSTLARKPPQIVVFQGYFP